MSAPWLSLSYFFAAWMSAFDGMQPTFRQTPPLSFSTTSAFFLSWPSRMAAT